MRISATLLVGLFLASPARARAQVEVDADLLRSLQIELVRQSAFTSSQREISKNYARAAKELDAALKAGRIEGSFGIYADAVKSEGRIRLERGTRKASEPTLGTRLRGMLGFSSGSAEARQKSYDLQRLVTIFGRTGLLPNRALEKNALVLFAAHKERMRGTLKKGTARKATAPRKVAPPRARAARGVSSFNLARIIGRHR